MIYLYSIFIFEKWLKMGYIKVAVFREEYYE